MSISEETRLQLFKDWNDGMTSGALATKYKITRSAIVGMISRARSRGVELRGDKSDGGEITRESIRRPRRKPPSLAPLIPAKSLAVFNRNAPYRRPVVEQPKENRWVTIMDLGDKTCRFINGEGLYCNENTSHGSWCDLHHARLTQPLIR